MALINEVRIAGYVATEPQQSGRGPHRFRLSHGGGTKKDGTKWPTQFFSVSVWDTKAIPQKGQRIEIWGKLRRNEFTDKTGAKRESFEIVAESIKAEESIQKQQAPSGTEIARTLLRPAKESVSDEEIPF